MATIINFNEYKSKRIQQQYAEQLGSLFAPIFNVLMDMFIRFVYLPLVAAFDTASTGKLRRYY